MSSPASSVPGTQASASDVYRPLSPLVLVGLGFAIPSLLVFVLNQGWVLLFLAVPGLLISLYARRRVLRSEGTLAGGGVAGAGIALSLISLLGWSTKYTVEYLIVRNESAAFVEAFLQKFKSDPEGKYAFLDTLPAVGRQLPAHVDLDRPGAVTTLHKLFPTPNGGSVFDMFRQDALWAQLLRYGDKVEWTPRGVHTWRYEQSKASYIIEHRFLMRTPELTSDIIIVATSELVPEDTGNVRREWRIEASGPTGTRPMDGAELTDYGRRMNEARNEAIQGFSMWMHHVATGNKAEALKMTRSDDPKQFETLYTNVRGNTPEGQRAPGSPRSMLLLKDEEKDGQWLFTLLVLAETPQYDVQFKVTMKGQFGKEPQDWLAVNPELTLFTKRQSPESSR